MNVLVTGASGWVGGQIARELAENARAYSSLGRSRSNDFVADLSEELESTLIEQIRNHKFDAVIHSAGLAHEPKETVELSRQFERVNVDGTRRILELCEAASIPRITYISSIAAYQWTNEPALESASARPKTEYARTKLEGESLVSQSKLDWRIARLATVFGTGDKANFLQLAKALKNRRFFIPSDGSARKSLIPVEVAAKLVVLLATCERPTHRLLNLALPSSVSLKEICHAFSSSCQFPMPISLPLPLLRTLARCGNFIDRFTQFPLNTVTLNKLTQSTCVDVSRMENNFPEIRFPSFLESLEKHSDYYKSA